MRLLWGVGAFVLLNARLHISMLKVLLHCVLAFILQAYGTTLPAGAVLAESR